MANFKAGKVMFKERVIFFISIASSVAVSYLIALIAYSYSGNFGLFEKTDVVSHEAHAISRMIYGASVILVVVALLSLALHYIKADSPTPIAFVMSVILASSLICIGCMSWFMFG